MLLFILGPILNILQQLWQLASTTFSLFGEISLKNEKNENVVQARGHNCWWMFKIGPNMNNKIPSSESYTYIKVFTYVYKVASVDRA